MARVAARETFSGKVHDAESYWYDTARWSHWVEGLERVLSVEGDWPRVGSRVRWESGPAGRGHVVEKVTSYEPRHGQQLEVEDDSIRGDQSISFEPADDGVEVELALDYQIKRRTIFTPLVDLLFIRRAMTASLRRTLSRFGAGLSDSLSG